VHQFGFSLHDFFPDFTFISARMKYCEFEGDENDYGFNIDIMGYIAMYLTDQWAACNVQ